MIGAFYPQWRTAVVVRHVAESRAEAARRLPAQQREIDAVPVTIERSPGAGPEPGQPSREGA
jgi:hypothetical protein